jgi:hypothetical protein
MPTPRPTLLNSSAFAATASELRFRIQGPEPRPRAVRVIALDPDAADKVAFAAAHGEWRQTQFFVYEPGTPITRSPDGTLDLLLRSPNGGSVQFSQTLADADFVFMVATADGGADAAEAIGEVCWYRQITTGAVAVGDPSTTRRAVDALRPHARVMLITDHDDDVAAILLALRA